MKQKYKKLAKSFSDEAREVAVLGNEAFIPHKFTPKGELVEPWNSPGMNDVSILNLTELKFLCLWRDNKWDEMKTRKDCQLTEEVAEKCLKKLSYFKTEDARIRALAQEACPERIIAKDMENIQTGTLNDSQHKSMDRVAKVIGAFKPSTEINIQQNVFNAPPMSKEAWEAVKQIAEKECQVVEAEQVA